MAKSKSLAGAPAIAASPASIIDDSFFDKRIKKDRASHKALRALAFGSACGRAISNDQVAEALSAAKVPLEDERAVWTEAVQAALAFVNSGKILADAAAIIERADTSSGEWRAMAKELILLETRVIPQLHRDVPRLRGESQNIKREITDAIESLLAAARSMPGTVGQRAGALTKDFNARWAGRNTARELVLKLFDAIDLPKPDGKPAMTPDETRAAKSALKSAEAEAARCEDELAAATAALVKFAESGGVE